MKRRAFTLIELLVVIAIIAILAAILFPVFAQARAKARQITCVSQVKQVGNAILMYVQDYDEVHPPNQWDSVLCPWPTVCGTSMTSVGFLYLVQPYSKNSLYSQCPDAKRPDQSNATAKRTWTEGRVGYGMSVPVPGSGGFRELARIDAPANHILVCDGIPDGPSSQPGYTASGIYVTQIDTPFTGTAYGFSTQQSGNFHQRPHGRHNGMVSTLFCDGHVKAMTFESLYPVTEKFCEGSSGRACATIHLSTQPANFPKQWEIWK